MGGACSIGCMGGRISSEELDENVEMKNQNSDISINNNLKRRKSFGNLKKKKNKNSLDDPISASPQRFYSGELGISADLKVPPRGSSFIGRASYAGLEKAVDVLDALGSGITNLSNSGFLTGKVAKGSKISILAFEVANTITRGTNLMQSLSKDNVRFIKEDVIPSEGVENLVSSDIKVLLRLVASDKREELDVFCKEVIRFGDLCKDPQWHSLNRFFMKLDSENAVYGPPRDHVEAKMHELMALAQHTSELYHELNACDRFEQDYRQKVEELKSLNLPRKGEHLMMLDNELKQQKKIVMSLKKKSLWSKKLEEVIEKLVDIVAFIHQEITEVFEAGGTKSGEEDAAAQRLGPSGLALHYANIINQIDNIASRPGSLPPNIRDTLYRRLPVSVKNAMRSSLRKLHHNDKVEIPQIKAEMEKTLQWLAPMASNTLKAHQGFGWVGEWANASIECNKKTAVNGSLIRLETLYHANKKTMDDHILTLITLLHQLVIGMNRKDYTHKTLPQLQSPSKKILMLNPPVTRFPSLSDVSKPMKIELTEEDRKLLEIMCKTRNTPGISKSQEFGKTSHRIPKSWSWSKSSKSSPYAGAISSYKQHSGELHHTFFL
ncbi:protein PSK SIMULATOR 2-like isoform X2 [Amaranthus tricolor]|uniref:protein PSK SIMULATOR 2-like isoform X2 n=1 Tax=Amaranthus tricolor TaxID=29722 RepID=UPI002586E24A|nr:protein PSK SIMULATOR 2-like isoform X2 [Amaranthus tricolor]